MGEASLLVRSVRPAPQERLSCEVVVQKEGATREDYRSLGLGETVEVAVPEFGCPKMTHHPKKTLVEPEKEQAKQTDGRYAKDHVRRPAKTCRVHRAALTETP